MNAIKIIAISGASGCGKTSVVKLLAKEFNCPYLFFDDHTDKNTYPKEMKTWLDEGANVSKIKTPKFMSAINKLKTESDCQFIFIEEPFGRERDVFTHLIDGVVLLDVPLEICLARIIKRNIAYAHGNRNGDACSSITNFLMRYEEHLRDIYKEAVEQVRGNSDLIIEGTPTIESTVKIIADWLDRLKIGK